MIPVITTVNLDLFIAAHSFCYYAVKPCSTISLSFARKQGFCTLNRLSLTIHDCLRLTVEFYRSIGTNGIEPFTPFRTPGLQPGTKPFSTVPLLPVSPGWEKDSGRTRTCTRRCTPAIDRYYLGPTPHALGQLYQLSYGTIFTCKKKDP